MVLIPYIKHTWSFTVNPSQMTINVSNGVHEQDVVTALRLEILQWRMLLVCAAWGFVFDVLEPLIDLVTVRLRRNGRRRMEMSLKTLLGWLQTQNLAQIQDVESQSRKTKDATTWHVRNAVSNSVGSVLALGRIITRKLVDTTNATSLRKIRRLAKINLFCKSRKMLRMSWLSTCSSMIDTKTTSLQTNMLTKWDQSFRKLFKSWTKTNFILSQSLVS